MSEHEHANQIRMHADGELPPRDAEAFDERVEADPVLASRVEGERALRSAVARVMAESASPAPAALVEAVRNQMAEEPAAVTAPDPEAEAARSRSWLAAPTQAKPLAVAATLALVCGAILFGVFGRQIDSFRPATIADPVVNTMEFVSGEHRRCSGEAQHRREKVIWTDPGEAVRGIESHMGTPASIVDLSTLGYTFVGAGQCEVPGDARSCHLMYTAGWAAADGCPAATASLFIVRDVGQLQGVLPSTPWVWVPLREEPGCGGSVACVSDGELLYLLVCCNSPDLPRIAEAVARGSQS